jgi:ABC-type Mn2+/Zn2+ transport system permease subunit
MVAFLVISGLICIFIIAWAHQSNAVSVDGMIGIWVACFISAMVLFAIATNVLNKG